MKGYEEFTEQEIEEIRPILRAALADTEDGRMALGVMLKASRYFEQIGDSEVPLHNFMTWILEQLGFLQAENFGRLIGTWAQMPTSISRKESRDNG